MRHPDKRGFYQHIPRWDFRCTQGRQTPAGFSYGSHHSFSRAMSFQGGSGSHLPAVPSHSTGVPPAGTAPLAAGVLPSFIPARASQSSP